MIKDRLLQVLNENRQIKNKFFLRTLLKDALQDYVLKFIYSSPKWKNLIFTGGTALRKIYHLPRFSEDLDFDYEKTFDIEEAARDTRNFFVTEMQYKNVDTKISANEQTFFLKFPILHELGLAQSVSDKQNLFLRCDFARVVGEFQTEISSFATREYSFFIKSFDLPTMFTNKITAFLQRDFVKKKTQKESFKGRDIFDLVWLIEQSAKSGFVLQPNWERLFAKLKINSRSKIFGKIMEKLKKIDKEDLKYDLFSFVGDTEYIDTFGENFLEMVAKKGKLLFNAHS